MVHAAQTGAGAAAGSGHAVQRVQHRRDLEQLPRGRGSGADPDDRRGPRAGGRVSECSNRQSGRGRGAEAHDAVRRVNARSARPAAGPHAERGAVLRADELSAPRRGGGRRGRAHAAAGLHRARPGHAPERAAVHRARRHGAAGGHGDGRRQDRRDGGARRAGKGHHARRHEPRLLLHGHRPRACGQRLRRGGRRGVRAHAGERGRQAGARSGGVCDLSRRGLCRQHRAGDGARGQHAPRRGRARRPRRHRP